MPDDPAFWPLARQAEAIRARRVSIPDLLQRQLQRIARLNPRYRAFSHVDAAGAAATARALQAELEAGRDRGVLHGITVSVKGSLPVAGLPWTEGSRLYQDRIATADAEIVARVRAAGGIVLGTTTLSELAMYAPTNPAEPLGVNPWREERTSGGSSTGAGVAAVLGMAAVNIGTDAGGSIRNPACHSGAVGFMASVGVLPTGGANYAPSVATAGLIGREVADIRLAFEALGPERPAPRVPSGRLLLPRRLVEERCDEPSLRIFDQAVERLRAAGFGIAEVEIEGWLEAEQAAGVVSLVEGGAALRGLDLSRVSPAIRRRAELAATLPPGEVARARATCAGFRHALEAALAAGEADAVVTPTWPFAAPPIDAETVLVRGRAVPVDPYRNCFVRAANATGGCALSLPSAVYPEAGVPAGLHLLAPAGADGALLQVAGRLEAALPRIPRPPVGS